MSRVIPVAVATFLTFLAFLEAAETKIQFPSGPLPTTVETHPTKKNPILVWLAYEGYEPFVLPDVKSARVTPSPGLKFMQSFNVAATRNEQDFHLLVTSKDGKTIKDYVGWVPGRYLVKKPEALQVEKRKLVKKALVVNTLESLGADLNEVKIRHVPLLAAPGKDEPHRLYTTMFVYGEADNYILLGNDPSFESADSDEEVAKTLVGWLPKHRIAIWNTREAVEWNHESTLEPEDRPTHLIADPRKKTEAPRRTSPGRIYRTTDDARKGLKDLAIRGIFEEHFEKQEKGKYEISPRLDHDTPRFPVLRIVAEEEHIKAGRLFEVGAIGALCDAKGNPLLSPMQVKRLQNILTSLRTQARKTDILFVIDDTESIDNWFPQVVKTVRAITNLAKEKKRDVRVAVAYFNDTDNRKPGDKRLKSPVLAAPLKDVVESGDEIAREVERHKRDGGGDPHEMLYRGIIEGFDKANFRDQARKMVVVIGDCGDISASSDRMKREGDYAKKYNVDAIVKRLVPEADDLGNVAPVEFYALQVLDHETNRATQDFRTQMKAIAAKYNDVLAARMKAQLGKRFDRKQMQQAEYFPWTGPSGLSVAQILETRYKRLLDEAKAWEEQLNRIKNGQWGGKTKLTPEMEQAINKRLEDIKTPDGKPVTLEMLRDSGGLQLFQTGFVWEKTRDGLPLVRRRVLINSEELDKLTELLKKLKDPKRPTLAKLMAGVIEGQAPQGYKDLERLKHLSLETTEKQWTGLKFRSSLLHRTYEEFRASPEREVDRPAHFALLHVRDLLLDIRDHKRRKYKVEESEQAGRIAHRFIPQLGGKGDKDGDLNRSFKIGKDNPIEWYYLDYEMEWP